MAAVSARCGRLAPWRLGLLRAVGLRTLPAWRPPAGFAAPSVRGDLLGVFPLAGEDQDALAERRSRRRRRTSRWATTPSSNDFIGMDGLVGLDVGQDVAFLDLVADLDQPLAL